MDIEKLKDCLNKGEREVLGVPLVTPEIGNDIFKLAAWALEGKPHEGRQIWFSVGNFKDVQKSINPILRCRIMPVSIERAQTWIHRGPIDSLLLPKHGFMYGDPNTFLSSFWRERGSYKICESFEHLTLGLWFWISKLPPLKLFGMCHHHAVLWDAKEILRLLGIKVDFIWLHDGRMPINEAIPGQELPFQSSLDIYNPPYDQVLDDDFKQRILARGYDGVITSHSLVTTYRLRELNLPMFHINSTRFGNVWIHNPEKHGHLVKTIQELLQQDKLRMIHNNRGDQRYFHQFIQTAEPNQEIHIPSLCDSILRTRTKSVEPMKFLIWDTRCSLIKNGECHFMKELMFRLKVELGEQIDSQCMMIHELKSDLPEGYLDDFTAVIHLPYNISTMSIFQQTRANIPVWIPSKRLMEELLMNPKEGNELSWTVFRKESEEHASPMDKVRDSEIVKTWINHADFYYPETMSAVLTFDSIDDLVQKIKTTDYQKVIDEAEANQEKQRMDIFMSWEQIFAPFRKGSKEVKPT